jgi:hypothetical protein
MVLVSFRLVLKGDRVPPPWRNRIGSVAKGLGLDGYEEVRAARACVCCSTCVGSARARQDVLSRVKSETFDRRRLRAQLCS